MKNTYSAAGQTQSFHPFLGTEEALPTQVNVNARIYETGYAAGLAGEPQVQPNATNAIAQQGWTAGNVERRRLAGEVIVVVCSGTRCTRCGAVTYERRLGCPARCSDEIGGIEWGVLVKGEDPSQEAQYMGIDALQAEKSKGLAIVDGFSGEEVELPPVDSAQS